MRQCSFLLLYHWQAITILVRKAAIQYDTIRYNTIQCRSIQHDTMHRAGISIDYLEIPTHIVPDVQNPMPMAITPWWCCFGALIQTTFKSMYGHGYEHDRMRANTANNIRSRELYTCIPNIGRLFKCLIIVVLALLIQVDGHCALFDGFRQYNYKFIITLRGVASKLLERSAFKTRRKIR